MHLRRRLMKLQSKFCQKSSKQTSKKPWESCDWKKVSWAYRRGTWGQKKKQKTSEAPSEQKESGSGGANEYLLLGIEGPSISALGVYYQRKAKPGSQRNWGTWALAKATSQSSLRGLKFFYIIYTTMLKSMIEKAVLGTPTLYGLWSFYNNILFLINEQFLRWAPSKRCFDHFALTKKMKSSPFRPNAYRRLACEEEEEEEVEEEE